MSPPMPPLVPAPMGHMLRVCVVCILLCVCFVAHAGMQAPKMKNNKKKDVAEVRNMLSDSFVCNLELQFHIMNQVLLQRLD